MKKLLAIIMAVAMIMSMTLALNAASVSISGKEYTETVVYDFDYVADVGGWSWNTPVSYNTTPSIGEVVSALANGAYVKIVANNTKTIVKLQSELGTSEGVSTPTYTVTDGDNIVAYYNGTDVVDSYLAIAGAAVTDGFWNLVLQPSDAVTFADLEIVELTEAGASAPAPVEIFKDDFSDGTFDGWSQHWGGQNFTVVDGALLSERTANNSYYSTGFEVGALKAGYTYTVTADIWYDDAEYSQADVPFFVGLTAGSFDGDAYTSKTATLKLNEVTTFNFTYTPDEDLTAVWFTTKQNSWNGVGVDYYIDNVVITETAPYVPEIEIPDEQVYQAIEKQVGSLSGVSSELELLSLGTTLNTGDVAVLRLQGTTTGGFRYWLSAGAWTACSAQTTVTDTEFDILVEVEVTNNGADSLQFKGPSYGVNLDNLTVTYAGIFKGTMTEYEEAFAAKKAELIEEALKAQGAGKYTGYLSTGDDYHMVIINNAVITTPHEYDDANICVYCGHVGTADDEIIIEVTDPVESTTDEEEDVTVDVEEPVEDEEPAVEENPKTGLALAIVPMIVAAAAVVISKR